MIYVKVTCKKLEACSIREHHVLIPCVLCLSTDIVNELKLKYSFDTVLIILYLVHVHTTVSSNLVKLF